MSSNRPLIDILGEREETRSSRTLYESDCDSDDGNCNDDDDDIEKEDELTLLRLQAKYRSDIEFLEQTVRCKICGFDYKPKVNYMNYYCRVHIGRMYTDGTWSCCNRRGGTSGCTPCMHVNTDELVELMQKDPAHSILEISIDIIDYNFIEYNELMITNFERGGDLSLTFMETEDGLVKRFNGKYYRLQRVVYNERIF